MAEGSTPVDTSASAGTERQMHSDIANAASASAAYWDGKATSNRATGEKYSGSGDPNLAAGGERALTEAANQSTVAANRGRIAGHHREKSAG